LTAKFINVFPTALALALVAGCGSSVTLDPPTIPKPLINSIPVSVAVRIPEEFEHFVHQEEVLGSEQWTIDLGRSNAVFFTQLFKYMFDTVTVLEAGADESQIEFDALIEPGIDAFEFSVPNQSNTDAFAVWIRYRVKVFNADGKLVGNFPFSAYGKSLTTTMGGSDALQRAAVLAMRDAAALMIIRFNPKEFMRSLEGDGTSPAEEEETASAAVQTEAREGATE
jgi:hypothetical protein